MPKGRPNSYAGGGFIQSMREKHEPHMKLAGKVESLEKNIPIELAQLHKTLSKSFGMQRKTLVRVLGLEKKLAVLEAEKAQREIQQEEIQEEIIEQEDIQEDIQEAIDDVEEVIEDELDGEIPEGLDDVLDDIRGGEAEEEVGGDEESGEPKVATLIDPPKTTPKKKKKRPRIKIRKTKISAADIKKGTPFDEGYASRVMGQDDKGEYLSKEERIRRFKGEPLAKPDDLKPGDTETPAAETSDAEVDTEKSQEGLVSILKSISSSVDGIKETLIGQAEVSKEQTDFLRRQQENKKRDKKESGLEKMMGGVKKVASTALKPVMSIWEKIFNFLTNVLFGKVVMDLFSWFSNPANKDKVTSIFRFIKDWWPLLVAGIMAFVGPGVTFVVGAIALLTWGIPKIVDAVKSIFGFGSKIDKELEKGESDALKDSEDLESGMDSELKAQLDDKQKNTEQPQELKQTEQAAEDTKKETEALGMNKGGEVPGTGDKDTVPAMLTPGEFVMSKDAVEQYGVDTMEGLNAAAGGTNIPTLMGGFNEGGKVQTMSEKLGHTRGTVTDPKEKKAQEDYMLEWVNKERVEFLGLPPLDKLTYAQGVELTQMMGPGPKTKEESHTNFDFDNMIKTTTKSKSVDGKTVYSGGSVGLLTEEDKQDYLASNPSARLAQDLKDQFELDNLGASISASAKMNGGGLVPAFNGGGLVQGYRGGGLIKGLGKLIKRSRDVGGSVVQSALKMAGVQDIGSNVSPPTTPGGRKVTTIAIPGGPAGESTPPPDNGGKKIPAFSASAKNSQRKIRTLGITL